MTYQITSGTLAFTDAFTGALSRVTGENIGNYAILQNTAALNANYTLTYVSANLIINKRAIEITADAKSKTYGALDPALTFVSSPTVGTALANGQTISFAGALSRAAGETVAGSPYAINQGTVANSNYTITYTGATLTIDPLAVTVTADAKSKTYGALDPALTFVSSPTVGTALANGQTISFAGALSRAAGETVAGSPYAINQGTVANSNYTITYTGATLTIDPLAVTVTADAKSKTYGALDPALTFVSSPTVGTALANGQTISFSGSLTRAAGENVGIYGINKASVDNSNYTINYLPENLTITQRPITVTAIAGQAKVYGAADPVAYTYGITSGTLATGDAFGGALSRTAGEPVGIYSILQNSLTIKKGLVDVYSNYNFIFVSNLFSITKAPVTSLITITPTTQQYSDMVTYTTTITGGAALIAGGPQAAASATFKVGTQTIATNVTLLPDGLNLKATYTGALLEPTPFGTASTGQMSPGSQIITAVINNPDGNYTINNVQPTTALTITQEDATVDYTGDQIIATSSTTASTATVTLKANISDINVTNPTGDANPGDIRNAKVKFIVTTLSGAATPYSSTWLPVSTLVTAGDTRTGTVSYSFIANIGTTATDEEYTVRVLVGKDGTDTKGYYVAGEQSTVVTVYKPTGDFITGGGYIVPIASAGTFASDAGKKTNFGFNVKYGSNGSNLKGNMNVIFRRTEAGVLRTYQIKANALQSLAVDARNPKRQTSQFITKSNLTDITNPLLPVSLGGNLFLYVNMVDNGEPGINDSISFVLVPSTSDPAILSNIMYSSNWVSSKTQQMKLGGGNLVVHSGFSVGTTTPAVRTMAIIAPVQAAPLATSFTAKVLPNPSPNHFTFLFSSASGNEIKMNVMDNRGRLIEQRQRISPKQSLQIGRQYLPGIYYVEFLQDTNKVMIKLLKIGN